MDASAPPSWSDRPRRPACPCICLSLLLFSFFGSVYLFIFLSVYLSVSLYLSISLYPCLSLLSLPLFCFLLRKPVVSKPSPATGSDKPSWVWPEALPWHYGSLDARRNVHPLSVHNPPPPALAPRPSGVLSPEPYALHPHQDSRSEVSPPETSWDLGPFAARFATWADLFSSNKMQRSYMGLEITACMCSWANSGQKKQNKTKN